METVAKNGQSDSPALKKHGETYLDGRTQLDTSVKIIKLNTFRDKN